MQALMVALGLGVVAVLQGGLNRIISERLSLGYTVLLNALMFLVVAGLYWFFAERHLNANLKFEWWYIFPGLLGAIFVFGIPWAMPQIGALKVFLCIVAGQMVGSLVWDKLVEQKDLSWQGFAGAGLAVLGVLVANL